MTEHETLLVTLVKLVSRIPVPPPPAKRGRGRPRTYPDRLFLQAVVVMIVRHRHTVHALLSVLAQPTAEMQTLRGLLTVDGRFPARRTWERRLQAIPATRPAQIGCLGRALVSLIQPWARCGRAAAIDSTVWRAHGGVWHQKDREAGIVPHSSSDTDAHWTKSGWHGWVYGGKLHVVTTVAAVWMVLSQSSILGQNPKIGCQEFNGLQMPTLSKKQLCDRTQNPSTSHARHWGILKNPIHDG